MAENPLGPSSEEDEANSLQERQQTSEQSITAVHFSGPIPHPEIMQGFDTGVPGSAERIITMAEQEQRFRLQSVSSLIHTQNHLQYLGWFSSTFISVLVLVGSSSIWLISIGHDVYGLIGVVTATGTLIATQYGLSRKRERSTNER